MERISATELNKHSGYIVQKAQRQPIIIERTGQPAAAIISYEYFRELEDFYFGSVAKEVENNSEYLSAEESEKFLKDV